MNWSRTEADYRASITRGGTRGSQARRTQPAPMVRPRCANETRRGFTCAGTNDRWPQFSTCSMCAETVPHAPKPTTRWPYGEPVYAQPDNKRERTRPGRMI